MKTALSILAALSLSACQTVRINGVDVTRRDQAALAAAGVVIGAVLLYEADRDTPEKIDQTSPGKIICKVDIETGACL